MNNFIKYTLRAARKVYNKILGNKVIPKPQCEWDPNKVSQIITTALVSDKPCMIARIGSTEMVCLSNYLSVKGLISNRVIDYVTRKTEPWWWERNIILQMQNWSGFFPATQAKIEEFCELMLCDIPHIDILGSWLPQERFFEAQLAHADKVNLELLNPYFSYAPWSITLEGKKVLVVHPFAATIEKQYLKRTLIFQNNLLPEFKLQTIKAVQSIAGNKTEFRDWFEALEYMKNKITNTDFDICLIGAGAYGLPLAAHVKRLGKKGFHLGGSLQLLFGIKGKRWENPNYNPVYNYTKLINEHWVTADKSETPIKAQIVENACYW